MRPKRGRGLALALALLPLAAAASDFDLAASTSFGAVYGEAITQDSSASAIEIGDLNGDGKGDLALGQPGYNGGRGAVFVLLSRSEDPSDSSHMLSSATNYLVRYDGSAGSGLAGASLAIGDVTGDGLNDLVIGSNVGRGVVHVVDGAAIKALQGTGNVVSLTTDFHVAYRGSIAGGQLGFEVAVGDLVGDGFPDLAMSAPGANAVYVMPSEYIRSAATATIGTLDSDTAYFQRFSGGGGAGELSCLGASLAIADIDGDGFGDLLMGDPCASTQGRNTNGALLAVDAATLNALPINGICSVEATPATCYRVRYDGALDNDQLGYAVTAGDLDNDGKPDLVIGALNASNAGFTSNGAAYVILSGLSAAVTGGGSAADLAVPSSFSYRLDGPADNGILGRALATGDFTGAGRDDLVAGDPGDSLGRFANGKIFVIPGAALPTAGTGASMLVTAVATRTFHGPATNSFVSQVLALGDFSGDGGVDLALGSFEADPGPVYVVYGSSPQATAALAAGAAAGLTMNSIYGSFRLEVPAGAFSAAQSLTLRLPAGIPRSFAVAARGANLTPTGVYVEIVPGTDQKLQKPLRLAMPYRVSDVANLTASRLVIARYDEARAVWAPYHADLDAANRLATANIDHLSLFGLFQGAAATDGVDGAKVYPNPFLPARGHAVQRFSNLPASATIKIHTIEGELVRELTADAAGLADWDGRNGAGQRLASGVYLAHVRGSSGGRPDDRILKVIIQK